MLLSAVARAVGKAFIISAIRIQYCAALAKAQPSDYLYRGDGLAGFDLLDIPPRSRYRYKNRRANWPMSPDEVDHETCGSRTNPVLVHVFNTHPQGGACQNGRRKREDLQRSIAPALQSDQTQLMVTSSIATGLNITLV